MGRILEAIKQAELKRTRPAETAPPSRPYAPPAGTLPANTQAKLHPAEGSDTEVPFIEVGGPHNAIEGSPSVLAASPVRGKKTEAPKLAAPVTPAPAAKPAPPVVAETTPVTIAFQPFPAVPPPVPPPAERFASDLVAFHRPDHSVSEQYRSLLNAMAPALSPGHAQVLLLAAASQKAGTTTTLLNLAITAARGKLRVVVVDADVRRPAIAQRLGLALAPGLHEVLAGTTSLQKALQETGQVNLHALTAGEIGPAGGARLAGEAMRSVLRHLRSRFDLTLVDTLPWDGRPDVVGLGSYCDSVYLVVRHAEAEKSEVTDLVHLITQQGGRLRGCILTQR
jgi:capsular exopolysaccharide synthesis family protein